MDGEWIDILTRLLVATIAGGLIGLERTYHGRPAGFRTHTLVCVASSLLMLVTMYQARWFTGALPDTIRVDPTRMAQGVMTGIGFLGAGVIMREGLTVRGLTTAASIWTTAAIGISRWGRFLQRRARRIPHNHRDIDGFPESGKQDAFPDLRE